MLFPKRPKHRKWQTDRINAAKRELPERRGITVSFGSFGLKAMTQSRITSNQIESARKVISRSLGKTGKMWIRVFPDRPRTQKAAEVPMGSGKGDLKDYTFDVRPGRILFELDGIAEDVAREALRKAGTKLPVKVKVVARV